MGIAQTFFSFRPSWPGAPSFISFRDRSTSSSFIGTISSHLGGHTGLRHLSSGTEACSKRLLHSHMKMSCRILPDTQDYILGTAGSVPIVLPLYPDVLCPAPDSRSILGPGPLGPGTGTWRTTLAKRQPGPVLLMQHIRHLFVWAIRHYLI